MPARLRLAVREWTDAGGKTFEAELIEVKKNVAVLKRDDGKTVRIPVAKLGEEDRAFLEENGAIEPAAMPKTTPAKPKTKPGGKKPTTGSSEKPGAKPKDSSIEIVGLQINKAKPAKAGNPPRMPESYQGEVGTEVDLFVSAGSSTIVEFIEERCKLTALTDDTGRDLLQDVQQGKYSGLFRSHSEMFDQVNPDGALLALHTQHTPAPGAKKLHLTGEIAVRCATGEKSEDHADISLAGPGQLKLGDVPIKFAPGQEQSAPPPFGQGAFVSVTTDAPTPLLKKILFLDADGKEIKKTRLYWSFGTGFEITYALMSKPEKVTVRILSYDKVEDRVLPLDVDFSLGL